MTSTRKRTVAVGSAVVAILGSGIAVSAITAPAQAAELPAFDSCTALQHWVKKAAAAETKMLVGAGYDRGGVAGPGPLPVDGVLPMTRAAVPAGSSGTASMPAPEALAARAPSNGTAAVGSSATGTNVQEVGVDEPDQVKTDGHYLVGLTRGRELWVATVGSHHPQVIGNLRLDGAASGLLIAGQRALVLVQPQTGYPVDGSSAPASVGGAATLAPAPAPYPEKSQLEVVELSDPHSPHVIAREDITGSVLTARQVGDVAWVVTQSQPTMKPLAGSKGGGILPQRTVRDQRGRVVTKGDAVSCTSVRHPVSISGSQLLTVQPVDITANSPFTSGRSAAVLASSGYVYASPTRLYVATQTWNSSATTKIHAFDISSAKSARYVGSGSVRGTLLSQWAMSEQDGYLRVATTSGAVIPPPGEGDVPSSANESQTSVVVLAEQANRLVQVGKVSGLGRGERVWAVRYLGNVAAVVTFRQTDPLYLVDLSNPRNPQVRGALQLSGYSSYLHPVGNGLLLGVGREADSVGHVLNAKATLFDISDLAHPKRVSNVDLGNGWSAVDGDTHAFTYLPDQHVALLPTQQATALAIKVDGTTLHITGHLRGGDYVQRFVPMGGDVIAESDAVLLDVDPTSLDTLGRTAL